MTGVLVLPGTAPEADWLEARRHGIAASEIAVVMGLSPWSSPFALYHRKTGLLGDQPDSIVMALGRHLESFVADEFDMRHQEFTLIGDGRALYRHPDRAWQIASPDRLVYEAEELLAVLEVKTTASYDDWGDDGSDEIPVHYRCQVLWQCDVLGVDHWYLACLFLHSRQLRVYEGIIDADAEADLKIMRDTARCFLDDIRDGNPPPVDWRPATTDMLKRLHPTLEDRAVEVGPMPVRRYRAACKAYEQAGQRKKLAENRLRELLGSGRRVVLRGSRVPDRNGVLVPDVVARRDVYDLPEKTILRRASTVDRLVPVKPKEVPQ